MQLMGAEVGRALCYHRGMSAFSEVSILVVSWNRGELLGRCLEAVRAHVPGAEVRVLDNGSEPALVPVAGVHWERVAENEGFAAGNNRLLAGVERPFVLLLNNDVLLPSGEPVRELLDFLRSRPEVGAAQGTLRLPDGTSDACGERLTPLGVLSHRGYRQAPGAVAAQAARVLAGKGALLMIRREAIAAAGGLFRPEFFCYYEDVDFCHRLWLAGYEVWYVPTEPALHAEGSTARQLPQRRVWQAYLSNMLASAVALWGWRLWLGRGIFFLAAVAGACAIKRVVPVARGRGPAFVRRRREGDFLPWVTDRQPARYYWGLVRKLAAGWGCGIIRSVAERSKR